MRFGLFYEHQLPRPWDDDAEERLLQDALDQVQLADELGFDYVWEVEHHFLEEYSHSSASEVFLAACSQRARKLRLGFGIVAMPPGYQHPARVAEKVATLDLVSGGRCDFGTGETASGAELGGFGVDRETKRAQREGAVGLGPRQPGQGRRAGRLRRPPRDQARAGGGGGRRRHALVRGGAVRRLRGPLRAHADPHRPPQPKAEAAPAAVGGVLAARD